MSVDLEGTRGRHSGRGAWRSSYFFAARHPSISSTIWSIVPTSKVSHPSRGMPPFPNRMAFTMQISGDNVPPPYHHAHICKSSSPIPAHPKTQTSIDTKHTSPKKMSSIRHHSAPVKSTPSTRSPVHTCGSPGQHIIIPLVARPFTIHRPGFYSIFVP